MRARSHIAAGLTVALCLTLALALLPPAPARAMGGGAAAPRASEPSIERQVMCAVCGVPLFLSFSPQAEREKALIRNLIAQGEDTSQIKRALVAQYGPSVLALPPSHGFALYVYVVPAAVVAALLALLLLLLPRWRRRAREAPPPAQPAPLSAGDTARLERELHRLG